MLEPEEHQIQICLLKSNLEEIESDFHAQRLAVPALNKDCERKYRDKLEALQVRQSLISELQRLQLENVQLTAKHAQLKKHSDDICEALETAREERDKFTRSLVQKQEEIEMLICKYEDSMRERAEMFRKSFRYYNQEDVNKETEEVNKIIAELKERLYKKQRAVDGLKAQLEAIHPDIPENFLEQVGKLELEEKINSLIEVQKSLENKLKGIKKHI